MFSTGNSDQRARNPRTPSSAIPDTIKWVLLDDWWLVKDEKGLAVEGFTSTERLSVRVFRSAEISKRHTAIVLETADGIRVTVCGSLNISRTSQNGFSHKVYTRFLLGFPFDWEEYAAGLWSDESAGDSESNPLPFCIDDVPATVTRDFMRFYAGDSGYYSSNIAPSDNVKSRPTETQTKVDDDRRVKSREKSNIRRENFTAGRRSSSRLKNSHMVSYRE